MMNLFSHNQKAYEAVMKHYSEGNRKAAVIQPCGTGKSYMGGAVASHFKKVLVIAPNDYVLSQAVSTTPHADTVTYTLLSVREEMPTGYDLLWFDELKPHRGMALEAQGLNVWECAPRFFLGMNL